MRYLLNLATLNPRCSSADIPPMEEDAAQNAAPKFLAEEYTERLDPSSIYCLGTDRDSRTCRVKNLYYNVKEKRFFLIKGALSESVGLPSATQLESDGGILVDLTSLQNHAIFSWSPELVEDGFLDKPQTIHRIYDKSVLFSRFVPGNTMHSIHDDLIGYYYLLRRWLPSFKDDLEDPFDRSHHLVFLDDHGEGPYSHLFNHLTDWPIRYKVKDLDNATPEHSLIVFKDAIVGNSKEANWYQYGFSEPQGPIPGKKVSGDKVRVVAAYLLRKLGIPPWNLTVVRESISEATRRTLLDQFQDIISEHAKEYHDSEGPPPTTPALQEVAPPSDDKLDSPCIAIFSRRGDRLMVNEGRLALALDRAFGLPIYFIRNEDLSFEKQVSILRRSIIAIGMHGSLLILSMFLPPRALLIELYPLWVPGNNYTPYKTLAALPGIDLWYGAWMNKHPKLNIPHPEYPASHGGLQDFSEELRNRVLSTEGVPTHLCCTDPFWLFRIYQDTYAHIPEILGDFIAPGLAATNRDLQQDAHNLFKRRSNSLNIPPAQINSDMVSYHWSFEPFSLHLKWAKPWNVNEVKRYGVWIHQIYYEYDTNQAMVDIVDLDPAVCNKGEVHLWIRSYYDSGEAADAHTPWSKKVVCLCPKTP